MGPSFPLRLKFALANDRAQTDAPGEVVAVLPDKVYGRAGDAVCDELFGQREEAEASIYVVGVVLPHERDKAVYGKLQAGEGPVKGIRTRAEADGATYPSEEAFAQSDVFRTKELHPTADVLPATAGHHHPSSRRRRCRLAEISRAKSIPVSFSATVPLPPMVRRGSKPIAKLKFC